MKVIISALFLVSVIISNVNSCIVDAGDSSDDLKDALKFIECARQSLLTGIHEVGIPSYNPFIFKENISYSFDLAGNKINIELSNGEMGDIPYWRIQNATILKKKDPNVNIFNFNIHWGDMYIAADYKLQHEANDKIQERTGRFYLEVDLIDFDLTSRFTKAHDDVNGTLDDLKLNVTAGIGIMQISNLGLISDIISAIGGPLVVELLNANLFDDSIGEQLKNKIIKDWIEKPQRIEAVMAKCNQ